MILQLLSVLFPLIIIVSHAVPSDAKRIRDLRQQADIRVPVLDHPDAFPVQVGAYRAGGGGVDPGFGFTLDEQPATGEQELSTGLPNMVVEFPSFLVGK